MSCPLFPLFSPDSNLNHNIEREREREAATDKEQKMMIMRSSGPSLPPSVSCSAASAVCMAAKVVSGREGGRERGRERGNGVNGFPPNERTNDASKITTAAVRVAAEAEKKRGELGAIMQAVTVVICVKYCSNFGHTIAFFDNDGEVQLNIECLVK